MRVTIAACLFPTVLGACAGGPVETAAPPGDNLPSAPAGVAGTYRLQDINGQELPALTAAWDDCRELILSAGLVLYPDRRYVLSRTARQECAGTPPVESRGGGTRGRYSVQGDVVRFDAEPGPVEGAAGPGWIDAPPDRRLAIRTLDGTGLLAEDTLTIRLEDGGIATFRKN